MCVVPRAKAENTYAPSQQLFRRVVRESLALQPALLDGTGFMQRKISTRTTHIKKTIEGYNNDGPTPYRGISLKTCQISNEVIERDILLVDDIYTRGVNIDEDAIAALLACGANSVTFYAVGKTVGYR